MLERYRNELAVAAALLTICLILAFMAPRFFSLENQTDLLLANIPVLMIAIGMTLVIITGNIDVSVGSQFAICAVAAGVLAKLGLPVWLVAAVTCALGAVLGSVNGVLTAYVGIPSIVVTLATMVLLRDSLRWVTQGAWIQDLPAGFQWFGLTQSGNTALTAFVAVFTASLAAWMMANVAGGRAVYASGSNANAARLAGIDVRAISLWVFVWTGMLTGAAAVLSAVRFNQIPANAGVGLELKAIAAVVVGGTAITGGRGTVIGTVLGVLLLGTIGPALTFAGVSAYWERAIQGAIILAAVSIDAARRRRGKPAGSHASSE